MPNEVGSGNLVSFLQDFQQLYQVADLSFRKRLKSIIVELYSYGRGVEVGVVAPFPCASVPAAIESFSIW